MQSGHRVAFNRAFAELGLSSQAAYSSAPAFEAALRHGGTGEALVAARLADTATWPSFLSTDEERRQFARRVHETKQRLFAELIAQGDLPLRPDVAGVVDAALQQGAVVALVAETASSPEEGVAAAALRALGEERAAQVRVLTAGVRSRRQEEEEEQEEDAGTTTAQGGGDALLKRAMARQKAAAAREFVQRLGESVGSKGAAPIDVSALAAAATDEGISPGFLSASAALLGVSPHRCACVAATAATVRAAAAAGMVSVAVPRQGAADASFPEAVAKFEAYGPGYLTWPRLAAMVEAAAAVAASAPPRR